MFCFLVSIMSTIVCLYYVFFIWLCYQPTISLEMPMPSQGHYDFHSFPVVD